VFRFMIFFGVFLLTSLQTSASTNTFTNPIITSQDAPDPWVIRHAGWYYFTATLEPEGGLWVWKSKTLTGLDQGEKVKVWDAPASGLRSSQIWAPELHFLQGKWYLYYTASDGVDANHRHYVLEAENPLGPYTDRGRVHPEFERYAIDGSILEMPDGRLYWMYCAGGLYIAPMESPTRATGQGVLFHAGRYDWEHEWFKQGAEYVTGSSYWVEAPQMLRRNGRTFVVYSAGHTAAKYYLGLLELTGDNPLDPNAWISHPDPIFAPLEAANGNVYAPGHNSFTTSADGSEDWLVYHAKDLDWTDFAGRTTRIQPFTWNPNGTPNLGQPIPSGVAISKPSGEP
jgi:GH43 family beta-xylosidase